jgi:prepilin peptidase CpaA
MREGIYISAVLFVLLAGWTDWRSRRIPNWLTVSGFLAGLAGNTLWLGLNGTWMALAGAGLMLALLLPVVLLRGLGAGDWKLMGALGAFFGAKRVLLVLFFAIFIAGIMALVQMIRHKQVNRTLQNVWELVQGFFIYGIRPNPTVSLDNPGLLKLPFGIAVTVATVAYFCLARNG